MEWTLFFQILGLMFFATACLITLKGTKRR